jgi:hypothetical protein
LAGTNRPPRQFFSSSEFDFTYRGAIGVLAAAHNIHAPAKILHTDTFLFKLKPHGKKANSLRRKFARIQYRVADEGKQMKQAIFGGARELVKVRTTLLQHSRAPFINHTRHGLGFISILKGRMHINKDITWPNKGYKTQQ